ncbi:hypothetical protein FH972_017424 [Carpinus fangiana]|uniref:Uncharacterized protein n=1 Tax=Carpinus fangiana TaxID=176857 RepID=A0A5N6RIV9_9ROSI|nr:hypothetical protein FH972_017424 [Carpinus fangiana]
MYQKVGRHQRKASQCVFMSFDDPSAPPSDKAVLPSPPNQAKPPHEIGAPLPSTQAPVSASAESLSKDDDKKPADVAN